MRSKLRASVIAVSMATIMSLSVTGCASQKTNEFNDSTPAMSQSVESGTGVKATDGVTDHNIIDNTGKFTYPLSLTPFNGAAQAGQQRGTNKG